MAPFCTLRFVEVRVGIIDEHGIVVLFAGVLLPVVFVDVVLVDVVLVGVVPFVFVGVVLLVVVVDVVVDRFDRRGRARCDDVVGNAVIGLDGLSGDSSDVPSI